MDGWAVLGPAVITRSLPGTSDMMLYIGKCHSITINRLALLNAKVWAGLCVPPSLVCNLLCAVYWTCLNW